MFRPGGTYSLKLRLRACFVTIGASGIWSILGLSEGPDVLPRDRYSEALDKDSCEGSLGRMPRLEPVLEAIEEVRDKDWELRRPGSFHGDAPPIGDGNGVISPMAISWGDDKREAGEREPPL